MGQERSGPKARTDGLIWKEVDGELVVYDERVHRMALLNRSATVVWRACDGSRTPAELLTCVRAELGDLADEDLVALALDDLAGNDLLEGGAPTRSRREMRVSRRRFIGRAGTVGIAATLLPVVARLVAPTPAAAGSMPVVTVPGGGGPVVTFTFGGG
jgi:Coenzyme PQQ synthesis protein D (PqqD)